MDFSSDDTEEASKAFLLEVGTLFAESRDELSELWLAACQDTWKDALAKLQPSPKAVCTHEKFSSEDLEDDGAETKNSKIEQRGSSQVSSQRKTGYSSLRSPLDDETNSSTSAASSDSSQIYRDSMAVDIADGSSIYVSGRITSRYDSLHASTIREPINLSLADPEDAEANAFEPTHTSPSTCRRCAPNDPTIFPFVSDVAPLAILMFLEAIHNHPELMFNPMTPAYTSRRPEYLSNGMSFRVTHVPWEQVRADTEGKFVQDAVYKRLNRTASRGAWLDFMKDLVVTHHMTYHVSPSHKRNIVRLAGLGWERTIDDLLGEPTLAPVIALEYASYGTLQDLYYSSEFLSSYKRKIQLLSDIADGLQALHFSNIVHGDVKPDNILICKDHDQGVIAKLSDFGLSIIDPSAGPDYQQMPGGTFAYLAPEAASDMHRDNLKYTDVYSFGIVVWQTLLGGTLPFFSPRYANGELLSPKEIEMLKNGTHAGLAEAYNVFVNPTSFQELNRNEELEDEPYEPPEDNVNDLYLAILQEHLLPLCRSDEDGVDSAGIPISELRALLSIVQICLSSCPVHRRLQSVSVLLGRPFTREDLMISRIDWIEKVEVALGKDLEYQKAPSRAKEMFTTIFEQFFAVLQRNTTLHDRDRLGQWDGVMAKFLGSSLVDFYLSKWLEGDHSDSIRQSILSYFALSTATANVPLTSASLGIHQYLGAKMIYPKLYTTGTAIALYHGDNSLWHHSNPEYKEFEGLLSKGLMTTMQECLDETQTRIVGHLLHDHDVGSIDVDYQDDEGSTVLHLASEVGAAHLILKLLEHGASAAIEDEDEEEAMFGLHQLPRALPRLIDKIMKDYVAAGGHIEAYSKPRKGTYSTSAPSNLTLYATPLLRAVARRNLSAVMCLVYAGAVFTMTNETHISLAMSPISIASAMLEYKSLAVMLAEWEPTKDPTDPTYTEARHLWEQAIGGFDLIDRLKMHGDMYKNHVKGTLEVLTSFVGRGWLLQDAKSSLVYAVECGDLVWVEALLADLYADTDMAVLADLQTSLQTAVAYGYQNIAAKLMDYGALPLMPSQWSGHDYTVARHGRWNEEMIDRLVNEMYSKGELVARSTCSMHFVARAGSNAKTLAKTIYQQPVVNGRLKPDLPDANNAGLPHFVTSILDGNWPRLNRADEEHRTPLYEALAHAEFELAEFLINEGAKYQVEEWSLIAQLFEDGRPSLPQQIEFLLRQNRLPAFNFSRRTFGRLRRRMDWCLHPDADLEEWLLEDHTLITATVEACRGFDEVSKKRCWRAILKVFNAPVCILAKSGDGRDALEIAIDAIDVVTLQMLLRALAKNPATFETYTVFDRARKLQLEAPPAQVADSVSKRKIIRYRLQVGSMMRALLNAGDYWHLNHLPSMRVDDLVDHIANEFPILLTGFQQRGVRREFIDDFRRSTENFINAFMPALVSQQDDELRPNMLEELDQRLTGILGSYFIVSIGSLVMKGARQPLVELTSKISLLALSTGQISALYASNVPDLSTREGSILPAFDFEVYRKIVVADRRITDPENELALPEIPNAPMIIPTMQAMLRDKPPDAIAWITHSEVFVASSVDSLLIDRPTLVTIREDRKLPGYYQTYAPMNDAELSVLTMVGKRNYFDNVVKKFNQFATNIPQETNVRSTRNLLINHVENVTRTQTLTRVDPGDIHPLFGKMKVIFGGERAGEVAYMDLPTDAYIEGARRLAQRYGIPYGDDNSSDEDGVEEDSEEEEDEAVHESDLESN